MAFWRGGSSVGKFLRNRDSNLAQCNRTLHSLSHIRSDYTSTSEKLTWKHIQTIPLCVRKLQPFPGVIGCPADASSSHSSSASDFTSHTVYLLPPQASRKFDEEMETLSRAEYGSFCAPRKRHPRSPMKAAGSAASPLLHSSLCSNGALRYSTDSDRDQRSNRFGATEVAARGWQITEESESDWRGHAAAIARSIQLIKTRMEWTTMLSRLRQLDADLERPDLWNDPAVASKISRERGALAGRIKAVNDMESELVEQIGLAELAREERDSQVEAEATEGLAALRELSKEKEIAALLSGEHDENPCYLEVQAGAGGVESMDWASMLLRMYRMWALHKGFEVSTVEEMEGEEAGIKVLSS